MRSCNIMRRIQSRFWLASLLVLLASVTGRADVVRLQSDALILEVDDGTAAWKLSDTRSGVPWPSSGNGKSRQRTVAPRPLLAVRRTNAGTPSGWPMKKAGRSSFHSWTAGGRWSFATKSPARRRSAS